MQTFAITHETADRRVRWVYDEYYQSEGSYAYDTEEETAAAVAEEQEALNTGRYVALGAIVETKCGACGQWEEHDSLWGIVIEPDEKELVAFADHSLDIPAAV